MKKLIVIIFVLSTACSFAQTNKVAVDTSRIVMYCGNRLNLPTPLYVINGKINKDGLTKIDVNSIIYLGVLKDKEAEIKYGKAGKNGVVIVTTKKIKN